MYFDGGLLALTVADDGIAVGRIVGPSSFMALRDQRIPRTRFFDVVHDDDQPIESTTDIHPYYVAGDLGAQFGISLRVTHCEHQHQTYCDCTKCGRGIQWFLDPWSRSWASLTYTEPDADQEEFLIRQFGPRKLWDEVEGAYHWWVDSGSPAADQWRFTVTAEGQRVELDS